MQSVRQRAILTALGIRQWIPRAIATTATPTSQATLWRQSGDQPRDQIDHQSEKAFSCANASSIDTPVAPVSRHIQTIAPDQVQHGREAPLDQQQHLPSQPANSQTSQSGHELTIAASTGTMTQDANDFEQDAVMPANLLNFRLQACEINQWIVLINETDLQNPQLNKLWQNILLAFQKPAITQFSWPLSDGQRWHRMTGSQAALNGFLFRMGLDKRVGLMSQLADEVCPERTAESL